MEGNFGKSSLDKGHGIVTFGRKVNMDNADNALPKLLLEGSQFCR